MTNVVFVDPSLREFVGRFVPGSTSSPGSLESGVVEGRERFWIETTKFSTRLRYCTIILVDRIINFRYKFIRHRWCFRKHWPLSRRCKLPVTQFSYRVAVTCLSKPMGPSKHRVSKLNQTFVLFSNKQALWDQSTGWIWHFTFQFTSVRLRWFLNLVFQQL